MKPKKQESLTAQEAHLIQQLRQNPKMMARMQTILDLADNADGPLKTADEIEEVLVEEMRRLGNETLHHWASKAEERVAKTFREEHPQARSRKKKA
jgi:hypothetical protein